jgi:serine/threonine protein phosphatase 1
MKKQEALAGGIHRSSTMSTYAIGDVHGNWPALDDLLGQLRHAVTDGDVVVFLGDYIDRGPRTKDCVDAILAFQDEVAAEVVCLCGNHEDWFLQTRRDYRRHSWLLGMNGFETIRSYSVDAAQTLREAAFSAGTQLYIGQCELPYDVFFNCLPVAHVRFFDTLRSHFQSPDCVCTHAGLDPAVVDIQEQARRDLLWGVDSFPRCYDGAETVVYGHWNNAVLDLDGWPAPAVLGRTIGVDTIAHGVLTAIRLPDRRVFQSARYERGGADA